MAKQQESYKWKVAAKPFGNSHNWTLNGKFTTLSSLRLVEPRESAMRQILILAILFHVFMEASSTSLDSELVFCLTSKMADFLTYLTTTTRVKNWTYQYCLPRHGQT